MASPLVSWKIYNGLGPKEGPKAIPISLPFSAQIGEIPFDYNLLAEDAIFGMLQSIWIDNALNSSPLTLTLTGGTGQVIRCPSFSQGMFPALANGKQKIVAATAAADIVVPIILLNVPQPYFVYSVS